MEISLSKIENRLKEWIEKNTDRLTSRDLQSKLVKELLSSMKDNIFISVNRTYIAPSHYSIRINPKIQKNKLARENLALRMVKMLKEIALENHITFIHEPLIEFHFDSSFQLNEIKVSVLDKYSMNDTERMINPSYKLKERIQEKNSGHFFLKINEGAIFPLEDSVTNIGRNPDNSLKVSDPRVSRHHAQLRRIENRFVLSDLNSAGGTFINGQKISQQELNSGDIISLAGFPLLFMEKVEPIQPTLNENETQKKE
jgi:hypothetical protein